jgi:hypothetical protein
MKTFTLAAAAALVLTASLAFAQGPPAGGPPSAGTQVGPNYVDANGDGICDNYGARSGQRAGRRAGPGNGTGNKGNGPKDGTGYGAMSGAGKGTGAGTGTCPYGNAGRGRRGGRG